MRIRIRLNKSNPNLLVSMWGWIIINHCNYILPFSFQRTSDVFMNLLTYLTKIVFCRRTYRSVCCEALIWPAAVHSQLKMQKNAKKKNLCLRFGCMRNLRRLDFFLNVVSKTYRKRLWPKIAPFFYSSPFLWLAYLFHIISWNIYWILNSVIDNL